MHAHACVCALFFWAHREWRGAKLKGRQAHDNATSLSFMTAITLEEYHEEQWTPTHNDDASIVDTAAMLVGFP